MQLGGRMRYLTVGKRVLARPVQALIWALIWLTLPAMAAELSDTRKKAVVYQMYAQYKNDFPAVADISPQTAMALWDQGRVLCGDTRDPAEMAVSRLPGAITREAFLQDPTRYNDRTVVVYCTISYRSGVFAQKMSPLGITVYNLAGGILAWALEGGKVYDDRGESRRLHVYGKKWDYVPQGYESVRFGWLEHVF
jgi:rhodanese-related sulfurtransferase